jgi:hypothetical protein
MDVVCQYIVWNDLMKTYWMLTPHTKWLRSSSNHPILLNEID